MSQSSQQDPAKDALLSSAGEVSGGSPRNSFSVVEKVAALAFALSAVAVIGKFVIANGWKGQEATPSAVGKRTCAFAGDRVDGLQFSQQPAPCCDGQPAIQSGICPKTVCALAGMDVHNAALYVVPTPAPCCHGGDWERHGTQLVCPKSAAEVTEGGLSLKKHFDLSKDPKEEFNIQVMPDWGLTNSCSNYVDDNTTVFCRDDKLILKVSSECGDGKCLNSGRAVSKDAFSYGVFAFTATVPKCNEVWPAMWLLPVAGEGAPKYGGWPCSGEIDVLETVHDSPWGTFNIVSGYGSKTLDLHGYQQGLESEVSCNKCMPYSLQSTETLGLNQSRYFVDEVKCPGGGYGTRSSWDQHTFVLNWQPGSLTTYLDPVMTFDGHGRLASLVPKYRDDPFNSTIKSYVSYDRSLTTTWKNNLEYFEQCFAGEATEFAPFDSKMNIMLNIAVGGYGGALCSWGTSSCSERCKAAVGSELVISDLKVWENSQDYQIHPLA